LAGVITAAAGFISLSQMTLDGYVYAILLCVVGALVAKSGFLAAMSALAVAGAIGAGSEPGSLLDSLERPAMTIGVFSLSSWVAYGWSARLREPQGRLALMFARTSLLLANLGFWMGSMIGDIIWSRHVDWTLLGPSRHVDVPAWIFAAVWAIALIATGLWALRRNQRWVVNLLAVFGAIHFLTQYFIRMHTTPVSDIVAGVLTLAIALVIVRYNKGAQRHPPGQASQAA